jgi:hypothetical protein
MRARLRSEEPMKTGNGIRQDIEIRRGSQLIDPHAASAAMFLSHGNNTRS